MSSRSQMPPTVDGLLRWTVLGILIVFVVLPFIFYLFTVLPFHRQVGKVLERTSETLEYAMFRRSIQDGGDPKALRETRERLRKMTAVTGQAAQFNRTLHVALIETDTPNPSEIVIDLGEAGNAAVVLVSATPILWNVENTDARQIGKISFEGPAAFDVRNAHNGLIGGFRIGAFGSRRVSSPRDAMSGSSISTQQRFCFTLREWAAYYDVAPSDIYLFHFRDPTRLILRQDEVAAVGSRQTQSEIESGLCRFRRWR